MLKKLKNMLFSQEYLEWQEYKEQIDFLDVFHWQQKIRKRNLEA